MKKEVYNQRTIEGKNVEINGQLMMVRRVNFYLKDKSIGRNRNIVEVEVFDYNPCSIGNYSIFMYRPEWNHLCRCHWVDIVRDDLSSNKKCNF